MLRRWDTRVCSIKLFLQYARLFCPKILKASKRGRPLKRPLAEYTVLLALKEEKKASLREAEANYSEDACAERIDHSVIHYWEKKLRCVYEFLVQRIGLFLTGKSHEFFRFLDSTKFSNWHQKTYEFHTMHSIAKDMVFPLSIFFGSVSPSAAVGNVIQPGRGQVMADPWYDDNKALGIIYANGYVPIVKPNSIRFHGHHRRKARREFYRDQLRYRQRGRGESVYGSLTNCYGDRLPTKRTKTTQTRIAARVVCYLIRLCIRVGTCLGFIRHALINKGLLP
jgi:hypothetical protein